MTRSNGSSSAWSRTRELVTAPARLPRASLLSRRALAGAAALLLARGLGSRTVAARRQDPAGLPASPTVPGPAQGVLWVQAPNLGTANGMPPDFLDTFASGTEEWREARRFTSVWMLRATSLLGENPRISDDYLAGELLPRLNDWDIELALNVTGATFAACRSAARLGTEMARIARIHALGGQVSYLSLQSTLSKVGHDTCAAYGRKTGFAARSADIVHYAAAMTARFPGMRIGLVDAMPAKGWDYAAVYRDLVAALRAEDLRLSFLHLDFPMESAAADWSDLRQAEQFVRHELGLPCGVYYVSRTGGATSSTAFRDNVLTAFRGYRAAGGRPDHLVLTSWYRYPDAMLPEDDEEDAPFMNLVRDFSRLGGVVARDAGPAEATPVATLFPHPLTPSPVEPGEGEWKPLSRRSGRGVWGEG